MATTGERGVATTGERGVATTGERGVTSTAQRGTTPQQGLPGNLKLLLKAYLAPARVQQQAQKVYLLLKGARGTG